MNIGIGTAASSIIVFAMVATKANPGTVISVDDGVPEGVAAVARSESRRFPVQQTRKEIVLHDVS